MIRDDFDQVDIDAPIPYTITALGRSEVAALRAEREMPACPHEWAFEQQAGCVVCQNCALQLMPRHQGIPEYLTPKERRW